jgi:glutamate/tyrosine decarboxylase-like PLP-dependent enzyme
LTAKNIVENFFETLCSGRAQVGGLIRLQVTGGVEKKLKLISGFAKANQCTSISNKISKENMHPLEKQVLLSAATKAINYLDATEDRNVSPTASALTDLNKFVEELPLHGIDSMQTIEFLNEIGSPATIVSNGGRYFGFVIGSSHPTALAANWLTSAWDQNGVLDITSPVNAKIERVAEKWLTEILPVAKGSSVGFVTGVTMANFCGLAAARTSILQGQGWDVEAQGLFGAPPITVVIGEEAHGSLLKALSMLGLGRERVTRVPADHNGCMRRDSIPPLDNRTILCLQAGNVNTGGMDDGSIIAAAKAQGAWVHIDGAFGLWAGASETKKHLTTGYDLADSWATDAHKWLNVPYDSGLIICKQGLYLRKAMSISGDYLDQSGERIPYQYTPEMSRRARAIDLWAVVRTLGRKGIDDLVTRTCKLADYMATRLKESGFEILNDVEINQILVSFGSAEETNRVIKKIQSDGTCWCGGTIWQGRTAMRISISSIKTTEDDIEKSIDAILRVAQKTAGVL